MRIKHWLLPEIEPWIGLVDVSETPLRARRGALALAAHALQWLQRPGMRSRAASFLGKITGWDSEMRQHVLAVGVLPVLLDELEGFDEGDYSRPRFRTLLSSLVNLCEDIPQDDFGDVIPLLQQLVGWEDGDGLKLDSAFRGLRHGERSRSQLHFD